MERVAVVADIHANLYALTEFLRCLQDREPVRHILNLGDFVMLGPHPREVAELILADNRFINILGNHEMTVLDPKPADPHGDDILAHAAWTCRQLGPSLLAEIGRLPLSRTLTIGGQDVLMVHARPSGPWEMPLLFQERPLSDFVRDYAPGDPDLVLFGHTHRQFCLDWRGTMYLNPGSLGCTPSPAASFLLLDLDPDLVQHAPVGLRYEKSRLSDDFESREVPYRRHILRERHGVK